MIYKGICELVVKNKTEAVLEELSEYDPDEIDGGSAGEDYDPEEDDLEGEEGEDSE